MSGSFLTGRTLGRFFIFLSVFLAVFLYLSNKTFAADAGEFVFFRVDTELDVPNAKDTSNKVTVRWYCTGATTFGQVTDNTASESTNALDGIIKVSSVSKEMTDASCTFGAGETLRASVSLDGWVEREWSETFPASGSAVFSTYASMDYTIVINGVDDELGTAITLDGSSASASYSSTVASQSYSGGKRYVAGTASGGTVQADADGYVTRTSSALTISSTASQSVDFGVGTDSDLDESGLSFAHKIRVYESGGSFADNEVTSGTVTAGDSLGTTCTGNSDGNWYCAVPLAHTATTAQFSQSGWVTTTATYTDRTAETGAQTTADITPLRTSSSGSPRPSVTPTPTPSVTPTPSPGPTASPTPTSTPVAGVVKLYRKANDPKVYVQRDDGLLYWVRTLNDFNAAGYSWVDVILISGSEFSQLRIAPGEVTSAQLFRKANDPKIYVLGSDSVLTWVKSEAEFNAAGYNWADVQVISGDEFGKMRVGGQIRVVQGIAFLRVRGGPSTGHAVLDQVNPGRELKFYDWDNGWYQIKGADGGFGWVYGGYVDEI